MRGLFSFIDSFDELSNPDKFLIIDLIVWALLLICAFS